VFFLAACEEEGGEGGWSACSPGLTKVTERERKGVSYQEGRSSFFFRAREKIKAVGASNTGRASLVEGKREREEDGRLCCSRPGEGAVSFVEKEGGSGGDRAGQRGAKGGKERDGPSFLFARSDGRRNPIFIFSTEGEKRKGKGAWLGSAGVLSASNRDLIGSKGRGFHHPIQPRRASQVRSNTSPSAENEEERRERKETITS